MFMVGDMKQSIYRFESANPDIFNNKYKTYSKDSKDEKVALTMKTNYRCQENVINDVNNLFKHLLKENIGNIEYNEDRTDCK